MGGHLRAFAFLYARIEAQFGVIGRGLSSAWASLMVVAKLFQLFQLMGRRGENECRRGGGHLGRRPKRQNASSFNHARYQAATAGGQVYGLTPIYCLSNNSLIVKIPPQTLYGHFMQPPGYRHNNLTGRRVEYYDVSFKNDKKSKR